jgi:phosphoglycerol transferase MdoB-like AlkP superfamily enzyme
VNTFSNLTKRQKYFAMIFIMGFLIKYNYIMLRIFYVPSITGLILKNVVCLLIIILFLVPLAGGKKGRWFLFILLLLFTIFFKSNLWYYEYFGDYFSFSDILMGERLNPLNIVIRQFIHFYDIFVVTDLILLGYLMFKGDKFRYKFYRKKSNIFVWNKKKLSIVVLVIVLLLSFQILVTNIFLGNDSPKNLYKKSTAAFVNVYGLIPLYLFEYFIMTDIGTVNIDEEVILAENNIYNNKLKEQKLNIIVIQIESLDAKVLDYHHNGRELTPFLNQFKKESL